MRVLKQILRKIAWLLIYLTFNIAVFYIEISVLFKKRTSKHHHNTGSEVADLFLDLGTVFIDALSGLAVFIHGCLDSIIAVVAFLIFIPIQLKYIKHNFQEGSKKKFLYSVLAALAVVMLLKIIFYIWMFIDDSYL